MKLCRNCRTINQADASKCVKCKMPDQLVDYNPERTREWKQSMLTQNKVGQLINVCKNCGTKDYGTGKTCAKCRFPLQVKQLEHR